MSINIYKGRVAKDFRFHDDELGLSRPLGLEHSALSLGTKELFCSIFSIVGSAVLEKVTS